MNNDKIYTIIGFIVGYALLEKLNPSLQNALGNWLMLVGQVLETNSSIATINNTSNDTNPIDNITNGINIIKETIDKL